MVWFRHRIVALGHKGAKKPEGCHPNALIGNDGNHIAFVQAAAHQCKRCCCRMMKEMSMDQSSFILSNQGTTLLRACCVQLVVNGKSILSWQEGMGGFLRRNDEGCAHLADVDPRASHVLTAQERESPVMGSRLVASQTHPQVTHLHILPREIPR